MLQRQKIELKALETSHQEKVKELTKANKKETQSLKEQQKKIKNEMVEQMKMEPCTLCRGTGPSTICQCGATICGACLAKKRFTPPPLYVPQMTSAFEAWKAKEGGKLIPFSGHVPGKGYIRVGERDAYIRSVWHGLPDGARQQYEADETKLRQQIAQLKPRLYTGRLAGWLAGWLAGVLSRLKGPSPGSRLAGWQAWYPDLRVQAQALY